METLEDHPVFNPDIKISYQQNERKKPPLATEGESALNFNLFEKSAAATEEEKGKIGGTGFWQILSADRIVLSWGFLLSDDNIMTPWDQFAFAETLAKSISLVHSPNLTAKF